MTRSFRTFLTLASLVAALAAIPSGASAITISSPTEGAFTNTADVTVEYGEAGGLMTATCTLDAAPVVCSSTSALLSLIAEGAHTFVVNGMANSMMCTMWDPMNPGVCMIWTPMPMPATPATVNFTVDRTPPIVSFSSGPAEGATVSGSSASFGLSANEGTVSCKLDGTAVACAATAELTGLTAGPHQLVVTSTDQAGNTGTAARNFVVGSASTNPTTPGRIVSAPKSVKFGKSIKIALSCPSGCTVSASLNGKSGKYTKLKKLVGGTTSYTFKLSAKWKAAAVKSLSAKKKPKAYVVFKVVGSSGSKKVKLLPKKK